MISPVSYGMVRYILSRAHINYRARWWVLGLLLTFKNWSTQYCFRLAIWLHDQYCLLSLWPLFRPFKKSRNSESGHQRQSNELPVAGHGSEKGSHPTGNHPSGGVRCHQVWPTVFGWWGLWQIIESFSHEKPSRYRIADAEESTSINILGAKFIPVHGIQQVTEI